MNKSHIESSPLRRLAEGPDGRASCGVVRFVHRLALSWSFETAGGELLDAVAESGYILAIPHASFLIVAAHHRGTGLTTMVSRSRDGNRAAELLLRLGYDVVRGSTSRGASEALRRMVRRGRKRRILGLTIDGPRGPAGRVQHGVVALAALTGLPIVPLVANGPGIVWPSWDGLRLPYPGARCRIFAGRPFPVPPRPDRVAVAGKLERMLKTLCRSAGL